MYNKHGNRFLGRKLTGTCPNYGGFVDAECINYERDAGVFKPLFESTRATARIHYPKNGGWRACTAWRVGAGNKMMTNAHCI